MEMNLRNAILILAATCFYLPVANRQSVTPPDFTILFTGYLLGYYRVPEIQVGDFQPNCSQNSTSAYPGKTPAEQLLDSIEEERKKSKSAPSVLVGMGDNLAV